MKELVKIEIPAQLEKQIKSVEHVKKTEIFCCASADFDFAEVLAIQHTDGTHTFCTAILPLRKALNEARRSHKASSKKTLVTMDPLHLSKGDRFAIIRCERNATGMWFSYHDPLRNPLYAGQVFQDPPIFRFVAFKWQKRMSDWCGNQTFTENTGLSKQHAQLDQHTLDRLFAVTRHNQRTIAASEKKHTKISDWIAFAELHSEQEEESANAAQEQELEVAHGA